MLLSCVECELPVSDKASVCPHCGYPLTENRPRKPRSKNNKRRRLPNGFGQISEIKGRYLRKPFRAMITVGKTELGRPISKPLKPESYFETYNDAYTALVEYNKNPYDLSPSITVKELYERWAPEYYKKLKAQASALGAAWHYCSGVYNMRVVDLRARHVKGCMEDSSRLVRGQTKKPTASMKIRIKSIFNLMLDYAVEYELVDRNYARTFTMSDEDRKELAATRQEHLAFSDEEMAILWDKSRDNSFIKVLLIQCYSGWRPQELGLIELANVDLENMTFTGGMKTEAGTERRVPIHTRIQPFVIEKYREAEELGSKYLINYTEEGTHKKHIFLTYTRYKTGFIKICVDCTLNPLHRPHDGRKHFVTMAKANHVDEYAIKYIVGHKITDLTERVYTMRDINWLKTEIEKIR